MEGSLRNRKLDTGHAGACTTKEDKPVEAALRSVTVIPPTINPITHLPSHSVRKRRVAGYARVSTDKDEQFTSYEAQIDYYTQYIRRNPEWEFVTVYTDEGLSGLNAKKRVASTKWLQTPSAE